MSANGVSGSHGFESHDAPPIPARESFEGVTFGDVLSALNPLQYVPVVGSIYRAVTGDMGSPTLRTGISAVTGVIGGPFGLLGSIAGALFDHLFHPEQAAHDALVRLAGHGASPSPSHGSIPDAPAAMEQVAEASVAMRPLAMTSSATADSGRAAAAYRAAGMLGAV